MNEYFKDCQCVFLLQAYLIACVWNCYRYVSGRLSTEVLVYVTTNDTAVSEGCLQYGVSLCPCIIHLSAVSFPTALRAVVTSPRLLADCVVFDVAAVLGSQRLDNRIRARCCCRNSAPCPCHDISTVRKRQLITMKASLKVVL